MWGRLLPRGISGSYASLGGNPSRNVFGMNQRPHVEGKKWSLEAKK